MALIDFFDRGCAVNRQGVAFSMGERQWRYDDAHALTCQVANGLIAKGIGKGNHGAVLAGNDPQAWLCVLGFWRAGLVWVPLNPRSPAEESAGLLDGFDVDILFFQKAFAPVVAELKTKCPRLRLIVCIDGEVEGYLSLAEITDGQPSAAPQVNYEPDDMVAIMPTGGTTGIPKGVMQTHRNIGLSIINGVINSPYAPGEPIVNLAAAPMTHTAGFLSMSATARGGKVVVLTKPDPHSLLDTIERERVTELFLPPTVIYALLDVPGIESRDFSSLRYIMYGAAPMSLDKLRRAIEVFGPVMHQGYGQTEAPGSIAFLRPGDHFVDGKIAPDSRLAACGLPAVTNALAIMDDDGRPLPNGETGEICVRGDIVMKGYYKQPDKTAEAIIDGWLHTGDLGHIDAEGFLHITDRKKDVIISGGFNVYPSEVEQVIWSHAAVLDCAVIGVPDAKWGEAVKAVVELRTGHAVDADELIALCKEKLGSVKAPKSVDFVEELPRSPVGKVLKKDIRAVYWADEARKV
jgi:acyl-CoA synthetase (AMP-forming)/AMP-acid ligase II